MAESVHALVLDLQHSSLMQPYRPLASHWINGECLKFESELSRWMWGFEHVMGLLLQSYWPILAAVLFFEQFRASLDWHTLGWQHITVCITTACVLSAPVHVYTGSFHLVRLNMEAFLRQAISTACMQRYARPWSSCIRSRCRCRNGRWKCLPWFYRSSR